MGSDPRTSRSQEIETRSFTKKLLNMIERGHPLFAVTQVTRKVQDKHVHLVTSRATTLKIKQIMIELGHPLFAVTQVTRKVQDKHVHLVTARATTLKIKQIMIERRHPLFAVMQITSNQC